MIDEGEDVVVVCVVMSVVRCWENVSVGFVSNASKGTKQTRVPDKTLLIVSIYLVPSSVRGLGLILSTD